MAGRGSCTVPSYPVGIQLYKLLFKRWIEVITHEDVKPTSIRCLSLGRTNHVSRYHKSLRYGGIALRSKTRKMLTVEEVSCTKAIKNVVPAQTLEFVCELIMNIQTHYVAWRSLP